MYVCMCIYIYVKIFICIYVYMYVNIRKWKIWNSDCMPSLPKAENRGGKGHEATLIIWLVLCVRQVQRLPF